MDTARIHKFTSSEVSGGGLLIGQSFFNLHKLYAADQQQQSNSTDRFEFA